MMTKTRSLTLCLVVALLIAGLVPLSCKRNSRQSPPIPKVPSVRIYVASSVAGAMEPCGCVKDMLGGIDHAAALMKQGHGEAPNSVFVGAGPMFFSAPELAPEKVTQDEWKAESIAASLADLKLAAWVPGANDFARGPERLQGLITQSRVRALASNLNVDGVTTGSTMVREVGGLKVGFVGISLPEFQGVFPKGVKAEAPKAAMQAGLKELGEKGAQVKVALLALKRGEALRLAETVPGYQVVIIGKPSDFGDGNDAPTPAVLVGGTLVVESPNHLQAMGVVDLFVRDGSLTFADGSGVAKAEQRLSLERRMAELGKRLASLKESGNANPDDLKKGDSDLLRMKGELAELSTKTPPKSGSFFHYDLKEVREGLGTDARVVQRMSDYYKKVNSHNRAAFKDRKPLPAADGEAFYVGGEACKECHEDAYEFWQQTGHAKAYETLVVDFKEFNLDCVSCHVTGYDKPGGSTVTFVDKLKDVQCEECHNPGSKHVEDEDTDSILLTPPRALCKKCHHTPHVNADWDVEEAWTHIIGEGHGG